MGKSMDTRIKVTVFTPTYNRGNLILNVYKSLLSQSCKDFEWIIMDDGEDNTDEIIESIKTSADFQIIYQRNANSTERGIGRAFNRMLNEAHGLMVLKLDDDDTLSDDAIETIIRYEKTINNRSEYAGVAGLRHYPDGKVISREWKGNSDWLDCTNLERRKYGLEGDKAEAYYLDVLKKYGPMPVASGENYTWEGVLWDRIAHAGKKIRWFNKKIYCTQYLPGGATDTRIEARSNNFYTYTTYVSERMSYREIPFSSRLKQCCRYFELAREKSIPYRDIKQYFNKNRGMALLGYIGSNFTKFIPQKNVKYSN
jgi:glycosyltransferase involved in cell wall biosynthesis